MYISLNNMRLFYMKKGQGEPIILIHGNGESHAIFTDVINHLSEKYLVYALDMRGQGASDAISELHYDDMAEDIKAFMELNKIIKPYFFGFSDGGIVGLLMAIKTPGIFKKMLIAGANTNPNGLKRKWRVVFAIAYKLKPNNIMSVMFREPSIKKEQLENIDIPTVIMAGQHDVVRLKDTLLIHHAIKDSKLIINKGENHLSYVANQAKLLQLIAKFLL